MHEPLCQLPSHSVPNPSHSLCVPCSSGSFCYYPSMCSSQVNVHAHDHAEPQHSLWSVRLAAADGPGRPAFGDCGMCRWISGKGTASRKDSWDQHVKWLQQFPHSPWQQVQPLAADRGGAGWGTVGAAAGRGSFAPAAGMHMCAVAAVAVRECDLSANARFRCLGGGFPACATVTRADVERRLGDNGWPMVVGVATGARCIRGIAHNTLEQLFRSRRMASEWEGDDHGITVTRGIPRWPASNLHALPCFTW